MRLQKPQGFFNFLRILKDFSVGTKNWFFGFAFPKFKHIRFHFPKKAKFENVILGGPVHEYAKKKIID